MLQLLERRTQLYERSTQRRRLLEESYQFQMFERDCDEMKGWINEKLKSAHDESYMDPTNLQVNKSSLFGDRFVFSGILIPFTSLLVSSFLGGCHQHDEL